MNNSLFALLLAAGSAGILLSFAQARSRAVFAADGFTDPSRRAVAIGLLAGVLLLTVALPFAGGLAGGRPDTAGLSLFSLFLVHLILSLFLVAYYVLSGHTSLASFLKVRSSRPAADLSAGILVGIAGWLLTLLAALVIWYFLRRTPSQLEGGVSPTIVWMVSQPLWVRIGIVLSAMVVEELFFRSFLQTRVGGLAATLMFTAAHGAYGDPVMLVGILVISAILSLTFRLYGNVLPCIVAHGTFDAIQMFVLIPIAVKAVPAG